MVEPIFNPSQALPFVPSSAGSPPSVGWGDLPELLLYGDQGDQSPWYCDAAKSIPRLASHQPPMLTPAYTAHTSITTSTILRPILTQKPPSPP